MKLSRASLGRNPLQHCLIDSAAYSIGCPIFGEPVPARHADDVAGQQRRVESVMADGYWHTVPALQKELKRRFGQLYRETSISARIRGMRRRGFTVARERVRAGSNLYQYRTVKDAPGLPSARDLDAVAEEMAAAQATGGAL